jgi:hypothetical protein
MATMAWVSVAGKATGAAVIAGTAVGVAGKAAEALVVTGCVGGVVAALVV